MGVYLSNGRGAACGRSSGGGRPGREGDECVLVLVCVLVCVLVLVELPLSRAPGPGGRSGPENARSALA